LPVAARGRRKPGRWKGRVVISDDFDAPLPVRAALLRVARLSRSRCVPDRRRHGPSRTTTEKRAGLAAVSAALLLAQVGGCGTRLRWHIVREPSDAAVVAAPRPVARHPSYRAGARIATAPGARCRRAPPGTGASRRRLLAGAQSL